MTDFPSMVWEQYDVNRVNLLCRLCSVKAPPYWLLADWGVKMLLGFYIISENQSCLAMIYQQYHIRRSSTGKKYSYDKMNSRLEK